jgi:hypothetical protein
MNEPKTWIELAMAVVMIFALVITSINRQKTGRLSSDGKPLTRGLGARQIQFICVSFIIPTISILALERILDGATVGTLFGGLIGYVLSKVGEFAPNSKKKEQEKS